MTENDELRDIVHERRLADDAVADIDREREALMRASQALEARDRTARIRRAHANDRLEQFLARR